MQFTETDPQNFIDIPEHVDYLNLMIDKANGILGNVGESLYGSPTPFPYPNGASHIYDSRLFLDLQEIVFEQDVLGWNNNGNTCGSFNYDKYGDEDCVFDIFIIGGGRFSGCGPENYVVIPDYYTDYVQYLDTGGACCTSVDAHAWNLLHEVGHSFGLQHSWFNQFNDIVCPHCVENATGACVVDCGTAFCDPIVTPNCWNNIMSYTFFRKRNFTPHQLAAMHLRSFSKNNHLIYLNVEFDNTAPLTISQDETWDFARIVEKNIIVEEGAKLTIRCKVVMAPEATITVKKGGALLVDGGHITTTGAKCDQYWGGIIIEGNPGASQSLTSQGDVKLENGALLEFANSAVVVQGGGRLRAFSSTIKDCRYGFYFYPYTSPSVPNYNVSYVSDCSFSVTDEHTLDLQPFVSLFGVNAINLNDCTFADERTTVALPNYSYALSTGIYALDARFRVDGTNTSFDDLYMAISVGTTGKSKSYTVRQATFNNCFGGILSRGINAAFIKDNNFTLNYNAARSQFTTDLASYLANLDGGKTAEILDFIAGNVSSITFTTAFGNFQVSTPQQLLYALQGISPYVSAPVLAALSENTTTYPRNSFLSLANQNPESLATGSLLYQIEGDRNLTTAEMNNLRQQATVTTARTAIELQLHEDYNTMQKNGRYLIIDQLADPNRTTDTELLALLEDQYDQASDYALITYATAQNNATQVANYTALLEEKISSDWQKLQYSQFEAFNTLGSTLQATSRSWNDLQATEITQLEQMAQANAGLPSAQARSVLQAYYGYHYLKLPAYPGASPGVGAEALQTGATPAVDQRVEEKNSTETAATLSVEASPNPAKSTVKFSIQLPANCHFANLTIFDLNGQQVYSTRVLNGQQSVSWFPNNLQAGIYYYYLESLDRRTPPQKIVLLK